MTRCHLCNTELTMFDAEYIKQIGVCRHCATYNQNYAKLWKQVKEKMTTITYPLSIREISTHPDAVRLTGVRLDGLPDGVHTGGAWHWQGEVYKPLDGRPFYNAGNHMETEEEKILEDMRDQPLFPANWRIEELNGRRFLVRPYCVMVPGPTLGKTYLDNAKLLMIEQGIRAANRRGWTIGDLITLGVDKQRKLFLVDLSNAWRYEPAYNADDHDKIMRFFYLVGAEKLYNLRLKASEKLDDYSIETGDLSRKYIYASFNRPLGRWCGFDSSVTVLQENSPSWQTMTPHSWAITKTALPEETITNLQLQWGYSSPHAA